MKAIHWVTIAITGIVPLIVLDWYVRRWLDRKFSR